MMTVEELWQEILEKDDRTSPSEYPDMALITFDEFREAIAALSRVQEAVAGAEPRGCPTPGACSCPAPSSQWQPIRTAKRDGSEIIARKDGYAAFSCFWDGSQWVHYDHDDGYIAYDPDEWMPLPASEHALALATPTAPQQGDVPAAWLGEGDGFKSFTRQKAHADKWRKGGLKVTAVFASPAASQGVADQ